VAFGLAWRRFAAIYDSSHYLMSFNVQDQQAINATPLSKLCLLTACSGSAGDSLFGLYVGVLYTRFQGISAVWRLGLFDHAYEVARVEHWLATARMLRTF
jgi:hypothetical protein